MKDSVPLQPGFDETLIELIDQRRREIRLKLENVPIKALRLSANTVTLLYNAGFRTVFHILHPCSTQLDRVKDINKEIKQEIREEMLWLFRQSHIYFQKQVVQICQAHPAHYHSSPPDPEPLHAPNPATKDGKLFTTIDIKAEHRNELGSLVRQRPKRHKNKKEKRRASPPTAKIRWAGKPGTQLHQWEKNLREQFKKVDWIGEISLSETEFDQLCQAVHAEAQVPNLVPPAVFITLMVFAARYAATESGFWEPYLRAVWQMDYSQAFMIRCRKRFIDVITYLEQTFGLEFPRQSEGDLVASVYRHALLPRYVQDDLANWLRTQWQEILQMSNAPDLLRAQLQQDKTVNYLPSPLRKFFLEKDTQDTAVSLILNMSAAINLHVNEGESLEAINDLLAATPIEQELWQEIAQVFANSSPHPLRQTKPRLTWLWALGDDEMILRVQNIVLPADTPGEPDRLVWIESAQADPFKAEIDVELSPWRMKTGEQLINEVILAEPDGPLAGELVLLTDRDEEAVRLPIPPFPSQPIQFFRLTQQGAYGVPIEPAQVTDGVWLVLSDQPLTMIGEDEEPIEPDDVQLSVPYPLEAQSQYQWAAQFTINLPVTIQMGAKPPLKLTESSAALTIGRPSLEGIHAIPGLTRQIQPTFASTDISITVADGAERLLKQASLWLQGQDGWGWQRPLAELQPGVVVLEGTTLHIHLATILPIRPNFYTAELRARLQPLLPAPIQFAVIPGLTATLQIDAPLYTPANPPQVSLRGLDELDEMAIVHRDGMHVTQQLDGSHLITWHDLRHGPRLLLRFDKVDIPLVWSVAHFMAWLEPKPVHPFLTLEDLQTSTLHATGTKTAVSEFKLAVEQEIRSFRLKNGRYNHPISQSPLYDMVRLAGMPHIVVKVQIGTETWSLFEVRQLTVGQTSQEVLPDSSLIQKIGSGQPSSPNQAEKFVLSGEEANDFVAQRAEIAENTDKGPLELTPDILYTLATIPANIYDCFNFPHLQKLWPPLASLKAVCRQSQWIKDHGYLPAWVLLPYPLILQTAEHKHSLRVEPIQVMCGGRQGKGFGRWRMSTAAEATEELVFVQWQTVSPMQVQVKAGLVVDEANLDWATFDINDTYALFYCERCGWLVGAKANTLPAAIKREHLHGRETAVLHNIVEGPYQLLANIFPKRRELWLLDNKNVRSTTAYLPEPPPNPTHEYMPLNILTQRIKLLGNRSNPRQFLASASRLLEGWQQSNTITPLGQAAFALGVALRMPITHQKQFYKLLKEANLTEKKLQTILAELNQVAPQHVQWGLTWAELLAQHSE